MLENKIANFLDVITNAGVEPCFSESELQDAMGNAYMWDMMEKFMQYSVDAIHILKCKVEELTECTPNTNTIADRLREEFPEELPLKDEVLYEMLYELINNNSNFCAWLKTSGYSDCVTSKNIINYYDLEDIMYKYDSVIGVLREHYIDWESIDEYIENQENFRCMVADKIRDLADDIEND